MVPVGTGASENERHNSGVYCVGYRTDTPYHWLYEEQLMDDVITYDDLIEAHDDQICADLASEMQFWGEYLLLRLTDGEYRD